jgi:hypothetical protein
MKKTIYFIIIFVIILSSCKNANKTSDSETDNISVEQTENDEGSESIDIDGNGMFLSFKGEPTFDKFLSFFTELEVPFVSYPEFDDSFLPAVIPEEFSRFVHVELSEYGYIIPLLKFNVHDKYTCMYFVTTDLETTSQAYLCVFDKNENFISSKELDFFSYMGEHSILEVDKHYNVFNNVAFMGRGSSWNYQGGGTAYYLSYTKDYEIYEGNRFKILENGKFPDGIPVLDLVDNFLNKLSESNFKEAFELQNNPDWGDYSNFSSTKAFGGIVNVQVDSLKTLSETNNSAEIFCSATYIDNVNGNSKIQQKFILSKKDNKWLITKMKVLEFERTADYSCDDFEFAELDLSNITGNGFDFFIFIVSSLPDDNYDEKYAGEIWGEAEFLTPEHAVYKEENAQVDFYFTGVTEVKIVETNCGEYRNENISFNGIYTNLY